MMSFVLYNLKGIISCNDQWWLNLRYLLNNFLEVFISFKNLLQFSCSRSAIIKSLLNHIYRYHGRRWANRRCRRSNRRSRRIGFASDTLFFFHYLNILNLIYWNNHNHPLQLISSMVNFIFIIKKYLIHWRIFCEILIILKRFLWMKKKSSAINKSILYSDELQIQWVTTEITIHGKSCRRSSQRFPLYVESIGKNTKIYWFKRS